MQRIQARCITTGRKPSSCTSRSDYFQSTDCCCFSRWWLV